MQTTTDAYAGDLSTAMLSLRKVGNVVLINIRDRLINSKSKEVRFTYIGNFVEIYIDFGVIFIKNHSNVNRIHRLLLVDDVLRCIDMVML